MRRMASAGRLGRRRRCMSRLDLPWCQRHAIRSRVMWWLDATVANLLSWHVLLSRGRVIGLGPNMHFHAFTPWVFTFMRSRHGCWLFCSRGIKVRSRSGLLPQLHY